MSTFAPLLVATVILYYATWRLCRVGPGLRIFDAQVLKAAVAPPRSLGHLLVWIVGVLGALRFGYIMFVQPIVDREIGREYMNFPGGIATAWLFYCLMFLPFLLIHLKCAHHFCKANGPV